MTLPEYVARTLEWVARQVPLDQLAPDRGLMPTAAGAGIESGGQSDRWSGRGMSTSPELHTFMLSVNVRTFFGSRGKRAFRLRRANR